VTVGLISELKRTLGLATIPFQKGSKIVRTVLWKSLYKRSAVYTIFDPNRRNTLHSLLLLLIAVPFAVVLYPLFVVVSRVVDRIDLYEVRAHGEFAWIVDHLERIRGDRDQKKSPVVIFVRSSIHHVGLGKLYSRELSCPVFWSSARSVFLAQVLLLQPCHVVKKITIYNGNFVEFEMSRSAIQPPRYLTQLMQRTVRHLQCSESRFVTMAVFTSTLDEQKDPDYEAKFQFRESYGNDFVLPIDFLKENGVDTILLGFPDTGEAHIPRPIPRLAEFGHVGGHHEVALSSGCLYFWADNVGASLLAVPFRKPLLTTNSPISLPIGWAMPARSICLPPRYQTPAGEYLTIRETLSIKDHGGAISHGRLIAIRNSPKEIVEAHREMLARVDGTFVQDEKTKDRQEKVKRIVSEFSDQQAFQIADYFLAQHEYLLD